MTEDTDLPDRRKHGYRELETKLENHAAEIRYRLDRFFSRALIAFAIIGIACAVALLGFGIVLQKQGQQAEAIQRERYMTLLQSCIAQNARHNNALAEASSVLSQKSFVTVRILIDELQPFVYDCERFARDRRRGNP